MNRQQGISKGPTIKNNFRRNLWPYQNARTAFKCFLETCSFQETDKILLPAYIGRSSREGSGVWDPVRELNLKYEFYEIDYHLHINVEDLSAKLSYDTKVLLLIHYFGKIDPNIQNIINLAKRSGIYVLEDAAHALYTSWIGRACGFFGDGTIYSLHKMLPMDHGGLLQLNNSFTTSKLMRQSNNALLNDYIRQLTEYDLLQISLKRRRNYEVLRELLQPLKGKIDLLWGNILPPQIVPQTLPILVKCRPRDDFYFGLNEAGFGVVSLWHELIPEICGEVFPCSNYLSKHILNLPIHQDCDIENLKEMVDYIKKIIND